MRRGFLAHTLAAALVAAAIPVTATLPADLLEPDQAFQSSARVILEPLPGGTSSVPVGIEVVFRVADGHYLYRDRLRFAVVPAGLPIGAPEFPVAEPIDDPFLGKTEIYRKRVAIRLPFVGNVAEFKQYRVRVTAQGCAEGRFCYSPFRQEIPLEMAQPAP